LQHHGPAALATATVTAIALREPLGSGAFAPAAPAAQAAPRAHAPGRPPRPAGRQPSSAGWRTAARAWSSCL